MQKSTLAELPVGSEATIEQVTGERRLAVRLMELGLVQSTLVRLERKAPLGDPIELSIRGYDLSIRRAEAEKILVSRVDAASEEAP